MKKLVLVSFVLIFGLLQNTPAHKSNFSIDFNTFYYSLQPYGEWIEIDYDVYVWRPFHVDSYWRPYSRGSWTWTNYGWYWESSEPFGWATYHYGRWLYDDYYGWIWYPDYTWAPAWVEWRYNDYYIGWTPLPPHAHFRVGVGIHFSVHWNPGYSYWNFVSYNHFCHRNVHTYFVDHNHSRNFFPSTKRRNNYYMENNRVSNHGISRESVEKRGNFRVERKDVNFDRSNRQSRVNGSTLEREAVYSSGKDVRKSGYQNKQVERNDVVKNRNTSSPDVRKNAPSRSEVSKGRSSSPRQNEQVKRNNTDVKNYRSSGTVNKSQGYQIQKNQRDVNKSNNNRAQSAEKQKRSDNSKYSNISKSSNSESKRFVENRSSSSRSSNKSYSNNRSSNKTGESKSISKSGNGSREKSSVNNSTRRSGTKKR